MCTPVCACVCVHTCVCLCGVCANPYVHVRILFTSFCFVLTFKIVSSVALADLKLTMNVEGSWTSQCFLLSLPGSRSTSMHHHAKFYLIFLKSAIITSNFKSTMTSYFSSAENCLTEFLKKIKWYLLYFKNVFLIEIHVIKFT